ncbi:MAG TPA: mechanosensitive ion channel family protein [Dehalococcoidia bacterium]|nr:mechanosensitive ion channel family protein [Dehalococcoidia bacterium]
MFGRSVLIIIVAIIGVWLLQRLLGPVIRIAVQEQMVGEPQAEIDKRIATLSDVIYRTAIVVVSVLVVVTLLPQFGLNAAPLIAGLGLVGLAVGFGAQNLVKDVINGIFILIENQYGRGDVVTIAGISGVVEDMNLRRTVLRDLDGTVHFVPHSDIVTSSNLTKGYSRVNLNVSISYDTDIDHAIEVINGVGKEMAEDPLLAKSIKDPPHVLRVDNLGDSSVELKVIGDTVPLEQWTVMGEFRLRIKKAFDKEGIVIPFTQRTLHLQTASALVRDGARLRVEDSNGASADRSQDERRRIPDKDEGDNDESQK